MEIYRYFSILAILIVWCLNGLVIYNWFNSKSLSLSLHAAAYKKAYFLFAISLTLNAFFFFIFAQNWLTPTYSLPASFMQLCIFTLFFQLIAAWVPDIKGKLSKVHNFAAFTLAICMPIILLFIINSLSVPVIVKAFAIGANFVMVTELTILLFMNKKKEHYLIYQVIYASVFHITLLVITFVGWTVCREMECNQCETIV